MSVRSLAVALLIAATLGTGACAESSPESAGVAPAASEQEAGPALVARARADLAVFAHPTDANPAAVLPATTTFGSATTLLVEVRDGEWLQVLLPTRPNGSSGWVRAADVELRHTDFEIDVDLAGRTLTVSDEGVTVLETPVAIGAPDAPTPAGRFFVTDVLDTPDGDAYGPFALGLSGHSDVLTEFAGGDGQIGLHGTDDPSSIGQAVSHGCVRVDNEVITQLASMLPLGTPVTIR